MRSKHDTGLMAIPETDLSQRYIENYRLNAQPVRPDYFEYLAQKTIDFASELEYKRNGGGQRAARQVEKEMMSVVDRVYNILEVYSLQLNKLAKARDLFITVTAPTHSHEVLEFDRFRQPLKSLNVYRTRFSTQHLSLVVRGLEHNVEFFLLPGDRVIGLSRAEAEVSPLMIFRSEPAMTGLSWSVEAKPLTADRLERYSLLALEHLLDKTREAAN